MPHIFRRPKSRWKFLKEGQEHVVENSWKIICLQDMWTKTVVQVHMDQETLTVPSTPKACLIVVRIDPTPAPCMTATLVVLEENPANTSICCRSRPPQRVNSISKACMMATKVQPTPQVSTARTQVSPRAKCIKLLMIRPSRCPPSNSWARTKVSRSYLTWTIAYRTRRRRSITVINTWHIRLQMTTRPVPAASIIWIDL